MSAIQQAVHNVDLLDRPGLQPIINASFHNLTATNGGKLNAQVSINYNRPDELLTEREYEHLLQREFSQWINPSDVDGDFLKHLRCLAEQTNDSASWIFDLDEFCSWKAGAHHLLWIAGRPGAGKSVLAANIIRHLQTTREAPDVFVGYAFASKTDEARKNPSNLVRAVIWQLLAKPKLSIEIKRTIYEIFCRTPGDLDMKVLEKAVDILRQFSALFSKVVLIFDGIDECQDPQNLVTQLVALKSMLCNNLQVLFVSQKIAAISDVMEATVPVIDMDESRIRSCTSKDILAFARSELQKSISMAKKRSGRVGARLNMLSDNLEDLSAQIVSKADGMFLWAALAIPDIVPEFLRTGEDYDVLLTSVAKLPDRLDFMLEYWLKRIIQHDSLLGRVENDERQRHVLILLRWVLYAPRPMTLQELQVAFSLEQDDDSESEIAIGVLPEIEYLESLAARAYPLVIIHEDCLRLVHSYFRDFVLESSNSSRLTSTAELLGTKTLRESFVRVLLRYLRSDSLDFELCVEEKKSDLKEEHPFLDYAAVTWIQHVQAQGHLSTGLQEAIVDFLESDSAVTWLEQWKHLSNSNLRQLQGTLYGAVDALNNPSWCLKMLTKGIRIRKRDDPYDFQTLEMCRELGWLYKEASRLDEALSEYQYVLNTVDRGLGPKGYDVDIVEHDMANLHGSQGRYNEAIAIFEKLIEKRKQKFGGDAVLPMRCHLGGIYNLAGRFAEAEEELRSAYERQRQTSGLQDSWTLNTLNSLVINLLSQEKHQQAKTLGLAQRKAYTALQGSTGMGTLSAIENLAAAESGLSNYRAALELCELAYAGKEKQLGQQHSITLMTRYNMSSYLRDLGRPEEALQAAQDAADGLTALYGPGHPTTIKALASLANRLDDAGRVEEAARVEEVILEDIRKALGEDHFHTCELRNNLGRSYMKLHRWDDAKEQLLLSYAGLCRLLGDEKNPPLNCLTSLGGLCRHFGYLLLNDWIAYRRAELILQVSGEGSSAHINALFAVLGSQRALGDWQKGVKAAKMVTKLVIKQGGKTHPDYWDAKALWASLLRLMGQLEEAEMIYKELKDLTLSRKGIKSSQYIQTARGLALTYESQERYALAIAEVEAVLPIIREAMGDAGLLETAGCRVILADSLIGIGDYESALSAAEQALESLTASHGAEHIDTAKAIESLGHAHRGKNELARAYELHLQAARIKIQVLGHVHPFALLALESLSDTLTAQGKLHDARVLLSSVAVEREQLLGGEHHLVRRAKSKLATLEQTSSENAEPTDDSILRLLQGKEEEEAATRIQAVHKQATKFFGPDHSVTLRAKLEVASEHREKSRLDEARDCLQHILEVCLDQREVSDKFKLTTMTELCRIVPGSLSKPKLSQCLHRVLDLGDHTLLQDLLKLGADSSVRDSATSLTALGHAVRLKDHVAMRTLLNEGCDVNYIEADGKTALHTAVEAKNAKLISLLLANGADPLALSSSSASVLAVAVLGRHTQTLQQLLDTGVDPAKDSSDIPAVHLAALRGSLEIVKMLIGPQFPLEMKQKHGFTPLSAALHNGQIEIAQYLLDKGANLNVLDRDGNNALMIGSSLGENATVEFVLKLGIDPKQVNTEGLQAIHLAAKNGHIEALKLLMEHGADVNASGKGGLTPLIMAAGTNQAAAIEWLLSKGANADVRAINGNTALHEASIEQKLEAVQALLKRGAKANTLNVHGWTPLLSAIRSDSLPLIELLVKHGAGWVEGSVVRPLWFALWSKKLDVAQALLLGDAEDLDYQDEASGFTCLHVACYLCLDTVAERLLEKGVLVDVPDHGHTTPLHLAVGRQNVPLVKSLIQHGANARSRDCYGRIPATWASGNETIRGLLSSAGDDAADESTDTEILHSTIASAATAVKTSNGQRRMMSAWRLGRSLLLAEGSDEDAAIAFEINYAPDSKQLDSQCLACDQAIQKVGYVCKGCREYDVCSSCYEKNDRPAWCSKGHEYLQVPRDCWAGLPVGVVDEEGTTVEQWASALLQRYGKA